jgi:hypothetical protein
MSIRIRKLDDGYLVEDSRGARVWEGAAVTMADAQALADNRLNPRGPSAPPTGGAVKENSGYAELHPLAQIQIAQANGDDAPCVGGICSLD